MQKQQNFKQTIVRKPGKSYVNGLTSSNLGKPDYEKTLKQHQGYIEILKKCNVEVEVLEADEDFPDSCFVEDPAVITEKVAVVTNPGAESRNNEKIDMKRVLQKFYSNIEEIQAPGTLEGGDILRVRDHFYIGISCRTNKAGAEALSDILSKYGYSSTLVPLEKFFHLKTGIAYLGNNDLLVAGEFIDHPVFKDFNQITVSDEEEYAANCIAMNDYVLLPKGFPQTKEKVEKAGYQVIEVELSEFQKQDGGLSCLSLRF
jgi:dimethylargininase